MIALTTLLLVIFLVFVVWMVLRGKDTKIHIGNFPLSFSLLSSSRFPNFKPSLDSKPLKEENPPLTLPGKTPRFDIIPVPNGTLKETSETYKTPFYLSRLAEFSKPRFDTLPRGLYSHDFFRPYGPNEPNIGESSVPFISSVNSFSPFPEVASNWEKIGILTKVAIKEEIMNLYRRPIAPIQDLFEYSSQTKEGFIIPLKGVNFLEDGDTVPSIIGKGGPWKANIFVNNKWVYQ